MTFLEEATLAMAEDSALTSDLAGSLMAFLIAAFIASLVVYVLVSLAFMKIAKKANYSKPGLAWIPVIGPGIIASQVAKMHWWPILLLFGLIIPFVGFLFSLAFFVFFIIWCWKAYETIGKPGWFSLFWIISPIGLIFALIAAYSKE